MMTQVAPAVVGLGVTDLKSCVPSLVTPTNQRTPGGSMAFDAASGPDGSPGGDSCRVGNQCSMRAGGLSSREAVELQLAVLEILEAILVQVRPGGGGVGVGGGETGGGGGGERHPGAETLPSRTVAIKFTR